MENNWVSVENGLPECWVQHRYDFSSEQVLVYDCGEVDINYMVKEQGKEPRWSDYAEHITHWQPLPQPPKE